MISIGLSTTNRSDPYKEVGKNRRRYVPAGGTDRDRLTKDYDKQSESSH